MSNISNRHRVVIVNTGIVGPRGETGIPGPGQPFDEVAANTWATENNIQITGSLTVSGSSTFKNIGPTILSGSVNVSGSVRASRFIGDGSQLTNTPGYTSVLALNVFSGSANTRINTINAKTGSIASLNTFSGSANARINNINAKTGSITALNAFTSSVLLTSTYNTLSSSFVKNTKFNAFTSSYRTDSASFDSRINGINTGTGFVTSMTFNAFTSSANTRINNINAKTGSITALNTFTGSINTRVNNIQALTGSISPLNSFTGSINTRVNSIQALTASIISLNDTTASLLTVTRYESDSGSFNDQIGAVLILGQNNQTDLNDYIASNDLSIIGLQSDIDNITADYITSVELSGATVLSSSFAFTASYISPNFISASAAASGFGSGGGNGSGFPFSGSAVITGSLLISGSAGLTVTGSIKSLGTNIFTGDQIITGSVYIGQGASEPRAYFGAGGSIGLGMGAMNVVGENGYLSLYTNGANTSFLTLNTTPGTAETLWYSDSTGNQTNLKITPSGTLNLYTNTGTASLLINNVPYDAHLATTASNIFIGNQIITGSLRVRYGVTGSLVGTASWATNARTASFLPKGTYQVTASWSRRSLTSSFLTPGTYRVTASQAITASYVRSLGSANHTASFNNASTWTINHNLNTRYVLVQTFNSSHQQIIPQQITLTNANTVTATFGSPVTGYSVVTVGGALLNTQLPAGNSTTIQYNNGGAFGGDDKLTFDGSVFTLLDPNSQSFISSGDRAILSPTGRYAFIAEADYESVTRTDISKIFTDLEERTTNYIFTGDKFDPRQMGSLAANAWDIVYLTSEPRWRPVVQSGSNASRATKMLGVAIATESVITEGYITVQNNENAYALPMVDGTLEYGAPVYLRQQDDGTAPHMSTTVPTAGIVRILGHLMYQNGNDGRLWFMRFRPDHTWVEI